MKPGVVQSKVFGLWEVTIYNEKKYVPDDVKIIGKPGDPHSSNIVTDSDMKRVGGSDGIVLGSDGFPGAINTADCIPLVIVADKQAALIHISRKTLIAGILDNLEEVFDVSEIKKVFIGPCICERHFVFDWQGDEIIEFKKKYPKAVTEKNGKTYLSLLKALQYYFEEWGVGGDLIEKDSRCTYEDEELRSYRRHIVRKKKERVDQLTTVLRFIGNN